MHVVNAEERFLAELKHIHAVVCLVCRRNHVAAAEAEEFLAHVHLKLIEKDYAIIRKFKGESSFLTYITTVIQRLFFQYRVHLWGLWRPSAEAKRLGTRGVLLEQLMVRDGHSLEEACQMLTTGSLPYKRKELEAAYERLPIRLPRAQVFAEAVVPDSVTVPAEAHDTLTWREREESAQRAWTIIEEMLKSMPSEDRIILRLRFWDERPVAKIATALHLDQRKLYRRIEKLLRAMRTALRRAGLAKDDLGGIFAPGGRQIRFDLPVAGMEKSTNRRSKSREDIGGSKVTRGDEATSRTRRGISSGRAARRVHRRKP